jgi:hypothetical protein
VRDGGEAGGLLELGREDHRLQAVQMLAPRHTRARGQRIGDTFAIEPQRRANEVREHHSHGQGPRIGVPGNHRQRMPDHSDVDAEPVRRERAEVLVPRLERAAEAPILRDRAAISECDLGLGIGDRGTRRQIAIVPHVDAVDADGSKGRRRDAPPPVRQCGHGIGLVHAQQRVPRLASLELEARDFREPGRIP